MKKTTWKLFLKAWDDMVYHLNESAKQHIMSQKESIDYLVQEILMAREKGGEIVLVGVGRCADILRMFMTRLLQRPLLLSRSMVKIVSEGPFEPTISPDSLVICLSGSGRTMPTIAYAKRYAEMGAKLIFITSNRKSVLVDAAKKWIFIPGLQKRDIHKPEYAYGPDQPVYFENSHPGPTLFECASLVLFDSVISSIQKMKADHR
jgi:D-arabinose 5-phosphate isomerase GutQ